MSGGVCDRFELVGQGEGLCIDERGGCFHEGEPIFIVVPFFKGEAPL